MFGDTVDGKRLGKRVIDEMQDGLNRWMQGGFRRHDRGLIQQDAAEKNQIFDDLNMLKKRSGKGVIPRRGNQGADNGFQRTLSCVRKPDSVCLVPSGIRKAVRQIRCIRVCARAGVEKGGRKV